MRRAERRRLHRLTRAIALLAKMNENLSEQEASLEQLFGKQYERHATRVHQSINEFVERLRRDRRFAEL